MPPMPPLPLANETSPEGSSAPPCLPRTSSVKKRQGEVLPQTTSTQRKDKVHIVKIKKGCRVKIIRRNVYHIFSARQRKKIQDNVGNSYNIYGTGVAGSLARRGWDVQFDIFPLENHTIKNIGRNKLITVPSDEEEKKYDRPFDNQSLPSTFDEPAEKRTGKPKTTQDEFLELSSGEIDEARTYTMQWGKTSVHSVEWDIQKDDEFLDWGIPNIDKHEPTEEIPFDDDTKLDDIFLTKSFLALKVMPSSWISTSTILVQQNM
jgi:hypothetical protein